MIRTGLLVSLTAFAALGQQSFRKIERTDEKELKVRLTYAAGQINLQKSNDDAELCRVVYSKPTLKPDVRYKKSNTVGFLDIDPGSDESIGVGDFGEQEWAVMLTDKIPASFDFEFGACRGDLDFSGMRVKDLNISVGASKINLQFHTPNKDRIRNMRIEAGASNMRMVGLLNANCDRLDFEGGIGSYILDFNGYLQNTMIATISVGVGKAVIKVPRDANVRIQMSDNIFSVMTISSSDFVKRTSNLYVSQNYDDTAPMLDLRLEAGFGKVLVEASE